MNDPRPPHRTSTRWSVAVALFLSAATLLTQTGCLGLASNLMRAMGADQIKPEYEGLQDARVAIVTITDASQYSNDSVSRFLSRKLGEILTARVDDIVLVREDEIEQWRDVNGYDNNDLMSMGKEVKADRVVAITVTDMTLREGQTLYRGKSNVQVEVVDVIKGGQVFRKTLDEFVFPENAGQHANETTEPRFEKLYLTVLAERLGRLFHPYELADTVAIDGRMASQ